MPIDTDSPPPYYICRLDRNDVGAGEDQLERSVLLIRRLGLCIDCWQPSHSQHCVSRSAPPTQLMMDRRAAQEA